MVPPHLFPKKAEYITRTVKLPARISAGCLTTNTAVGTYSRDLVCRRPPPKNSLRECLREGFAEWLTDSFEHSRQTPVLGSRPDTSRPRHHLGPARIKSPVRGCTPVASGLRCESGCR